MQEKPAKYGVLGPYYLGKFVKYGLLGPYYSGKNCKIWALSAILFRKILQTMDF